MTLPELCFTFTFIWIAVKSITRAIRIHDLPGTLFFWNLQAVGIKPLFIDMSQLNASIRAAGQRLQTPLSVSLLAMVEEAVAAEATAFLGSGESSMTGMIVQVGVSYLRGGAS